MIAIYGSGFGLYGHLPALAELGHEIFVPERYRAAFEGRTELQQYRSAVHFVDDERRILSVAELAVLTRRPADNDALARQVALIPNPPRLVIEKPPGATPQAALSLARVLKSAGVRYVTPYLMAHCAWARGCLSMVAAGGTDIALNWYFNSSGTTQSWKSTPDQGGGIVNYYFIHLIALAQLLLGSYRLAECRTDALGATFAVVALVAAHQGNDEPEYRRLASPDITSCVCMKFIVLVR